MTNLFDAFNSSAYWAITGRMVFDDEDLVYSPSAPCTLGEAQAQARRWLVSDALANADEGEDEATLRSRYGIDQDADLESAVVLTTAFSSATPIDYHYLG